MDKDIGATLYSILRHTSKEPKLKMFGTGQKGISFLSQFKTTTMKRIFKSFGISLMVVWALLLARPADAQPRFGVNISFQTFYDELSPYGDWIDYPDYGYTWRPRVGNDFRPYSTNGYWMYTNDYDWMWNSGYDWGWAPFHYGRWFYDPYYGWLWVPGYEWSPAWVAWRGGGDYYGWAPLRPGFSIHIGFGNYNCPYDYWTFAPGRYMTSRYISRYYHPYHNNITIINNTTIINNYGGRDRSSRYNNYYTNGPRRAEVERYTGRIRGYDVRESDSRSRASVSRNSVSVYRPAVERDARTDAYRPRSVQTYDRSIARNGSNIDNARGNTNTDARVNNRGSVPDNTRSNAATRRFGDAGDRNNSIDNSRVNEKANTQGRDVRFGDRVSVDRGRMNTSPRAQNAINEERATRSREVMRQNDGVMQRNEQMQREQESRQRSIEMRQRNEQMQREQENRQRSVEMRQRNEQMQREQENRQRSMETRQRSVEMPQQRQSFPSVESRGDRNVPSQVDRGSSRSSGRRF